MVLGPGFGVLQSSEGVSGEDSVIWRDAMGDIEEESSLASELMPPLASQEEVFSNFGENECGEPSRAQRLLIDFTPDPEVDTPESQEKCCEFWDFINSKPYLQTLCVSPIPSIPASRIAEASAGPSSVTVPIGVSLLEDNSKGFVEGGLGERLPASKCSSEGHSYTNEDSSTRARKPQRPKQIRDCVCSSVCTKCKKIKSKTEQVDIRAKELCKVLDNWDSKHPKSMEPPGPVMQYMPRLQRKAAPPQNPHSCFD